MNCRHGGAIVKPDLLLAVRAAPEFAVGKQYPVVVESVRPARCAKVVKRCDAALGKMRGAVGAFVGLAWGKSTHAEWPVDSGEGARILPRRRGELAQSGFEFLA